MSEIKTKKVPDSFRSFLMPRVIYRDDIIALSERNHRVEI